jgi:hypothetical protein
MTPADYALIGIPMTEAQEPAWSDDVTSPTTTRLSVPRPVPLDVLPEKAA